MGKGSGKGRKHPEAAVRINFLHQAAACVLKSTGNKVLSAALGSHMVAVGQKSQVRLSKEIKRTICKGCHLLLVPGTSASVTISGPRKQRNINLLCHLCKTQRGFLLQEKGPPKERQRKDKPGSTTNVKESAQGSFLSAKPASVSSAPSLPELKS